MLPREAASWRLSRLASLPGHRNARPDGADRQRSTRDEALGPQAVCRVAETLSPRRRSADAGLAASSLSPGRRGVSGVAPWHRGPEAHPRGWRAERCGRWFPVVRCQRFAGAVL